MTAEHDDEVEYDLVMPFVVCASQGGPFEDASFVAGWEMGQLDNELGDYARAGTLVERLIRTANVPQAELIAMKNEWQIEHRPDPIYPEEWSHVRFTRIEGQCEADSDGERCQSKGDAWEYGQWLCPLHRDGGGDELIYHGGPFDGQPLNLLAPTGPHDDEYEVRTEDGMILGAWWTQEIRSDPTCGDCGGPGVSWEDGVILCDDCAILRAKKYQMDRERRNPDGGER